jgi:peroxiredoxin
MVAAAVAAQAGPPTRPATPAEGDRAPDFELKTVAGEVVRLSDELKERPVVLVVLRGWPGYQCPICTKQVADLRAHAGELEKAGVTLILVYPGPATKLKDHAAEFIGGKGLPGNWRFVIDPEYVFTHAWGLRWLKKGETAHPSTFVIDREQVVRFAHVSTSHGDRVDAGTILGVVEKMK